MDKQRQYGGCFEWRLASQKQDKQKIKDKTNGQLQIRQTYKQRQDYIEKTNRQTERRQMDKQRQYGGCFEWRRVVISLWLVGNKTNRKSKTRQMDKDR